MGKDFLFLLDVDFFSSRPSIFFSESSSFSRVLVFCVLCFFDVVFCVWCAFDGDFWTFALAEKRAKKARETTNFL